MGKGVEGKMKKSSGKKTGRDTIKGGKTSICKRHGICSLQLPSEEKKGRANHQKPSRKEIKTKKNTKKRDTRWGGSDDGEGKKACP